ncbi:unnamed protein product [Ixodes pacificus]
MPCAVVGDSCFHFCLFISCGKMLVLSLTCQPFLFVSQLLDRKDVVSVCCYQLLQFDPRLVHSLLLHVWPPHPSLYFERDEPDDLFAHPGAHGGKKNRRSFKVYIMRLFCIGMLTQRCRTKKKKKCFEETRHKTSLCVTV